jgi:hypothetical protein
MAITLSMTESFLNYIVDFINISKDENYNVYDVNNVIFSQNNIQVCFNGDGNLFRDIDLLAFASFVETRIRTELKNLLKEEQ